MSGFDIKPASITVDVSTEAFERWREREPHRAVLDDLMTESIRRMEVNLAAQLRGEPIPYPPPERPEGYVEQCEECHQGTDAEDRAEQYAEALAEIRRRFPYGAADKIATEALGDQP